MALVTITEAARLTTLSEKTIRRKIGSGELSAQVHGQGGQAKKLVDTSELIRVFGSLPGQPSSAVQAESPATSTHVSSMSTQGQAMSTLSIEPFKQVIDTQKTLIAVLQSQLDARTQETRELRAQVAGLLEWRRPESELPAAPDSVPTPPAVVQVSVGRSRSMTVIAAGTSLVLAGVLVWAWASGHLMI